MDELQERRGPGRPPNPRPVEQQAARPARKPFGALLQRLAYPDRPNYHRHWFNDVAGRISRAQEAGYEHVKDHDGKNVSKVVGTAEGGAPLHAYLMEIPEEWYREDIAAQQKEVDEKESSIRRGNFERKEGDGRYVPTQGISIKHGS